MPIPGGCKVEDGCRCPGGPIFNIPGFPPMIMGPLPPIRGPADIEALQGGKGDVPRRKSLLLSTLPRLDAESLQSFYDVISYFISKLLC